jgi:uncharacterized protein
MRPTRGALRVTHSGIMAAMQKRHSAHQPIKASVPHTPLRRWLVVVGLAVAAGALAAVLGVPGGWLLGAMLSTAALSAAGRAPSSLPDSLVLVAHAVIGMAVSARLTSATLQQLVGQWPLVLLIVAALLLLSALIGLALARVAGFDAATGVIGMLPGGAATMVALSDAVGADVRVVTVLQYLRLLLVVATMGLVGSLLHQTNQLPLHSDYSPASAATTWASYGLTALAAAVGAWAGLRARLPSGALVGAALVGALLGAYDIPHGEWPPGVLQAAFVIVGLGVGLRFDGPALRAIGRMLPLLLAATLMLIAAAGLFSYGLARAAGYDARTLYLAAAPGGLDSVVIIALEAGAEVGLVLTVNMARFFAIVLFAPPLVRRLVAKQKGCKAKG